MKNLILFICFSLTFGLLKAQPDVVYPAEYPGGEDSLKTYIDSNLKYPIEAAAYKKEVTMTFFLDIDKEGKITRIEPGKRYGYGFDEEGLRLVNGLPAFKPSTRNGEPVEDMYRLRIPFKLPKEAKKEGKKFQSMPQFPGGLKAMREFIVEHLEYPESEEGSGKAGSVVVQLRIDEEGKVVDRRFVKTLGQAFNIEVNKVIDAMPAFEPGMAGDAPAKMWYSAPFSFTEEEAQKEDTKLKPEITRTRTIVERKKSTSTSSSSSSKETYGAVSTNKAIQLDSDIAKGKDFKAASFPGGLYKMQEYFENNTEYPKKAKKRKERRYSYRAFQGD